MSSNDPFFIVGSGRSGTTLLRLLLNGHSRIHIPPETWFLTDLVKELPLDRELSTAEVERATHLITSNYRWPDMQMDAEAFARYVELLERPRLLAIVEMVYQTQLNRTSKPRFGDKTPPYIHIVPQLLRLFPGAKFIHLVRDGRDVALSYVDAGFHDPGSRCYDGGNFDWISTIRRATSYANATFADRILTVRYEELTSNPEHSLRKICAFLEEEFEPQMLDWQRQIGGVPVRERHIHLKLSQPISAANANGWRNRLSGLQCFVLESCMRNELAVQGYPLRYNQPLLRPAMAATAIILKFLAPILVRISFRLRRRGLVRKDSVIF